MYEKFSREKAAENFFVGFLNDCKLKVTNGVFFPNSVFYMKGDEIFMEHDKEKKCLYLSTDQIGSVFKKYGYTNTKINELINFFVLKHLSLKTIAPPHEILDTTFDVINISALKNITNNVQF